MSILHMAIIGALLLAAVCAVGIFHSAYDDNLLQCCGLCVVCIGAVTWSVTASTVQPHEVVMLLGALLYAAGTLHKVLRFRRRERRSPWSTAGGVRR